MTNPAVPNRDRQHGGLEAVGIASQRIKSSMRDSSNWESLALHPAGKEALDMIAHKIARVLSGSDPHDFQHWEDIAGYATAFMRTWSELMYEGDDDDEGENDDEEDAAFQPVKDIVGRFPKVDVELSGVISPDDSKALADAIRSRLVSHRVETARNEFKDCPDGFCPMPNVRQGPAVMFDPAD
tara:strand:- start:1149 stop:1697 length:549 start_codon:yes stop_codon:yes gene_type:complete